MTPDQWTAVTAIATILDKIGTWPIGTVILVNIIGPWILALVLNRAQEKRFYSMKQMYENNVALVKDYEKTTASVEKMAQGLIDLVSLNTAKWSEVDQKIDTNQYCPAHRTTKVKMEQQVG